MRDKHPAAHTREGLTDTAPDEVRQQAQAALHRLTNTQSHQGIDISSTDVLATLSKAAAGKAAGPDGWRYEHYWAALPRVPHAADEDPTPLSLADTPPWVHSMTAVFNTLVNEPSLLNEESWRLLRAASLSAVGDKRRPIACASVIRRLLSSTVSRKLSGKLAPVLMKLGQYGCGVKGGVEHVATQAQLWHELGGTVLQLDCKNAFNSVDRAAMLSAVESFCPELLPYFVAVYCGDNTPEMRAELKEAHGAHQNMAYVIYSELGCQQGDPLGPLLFAITLCWALRDTESDTDTDGDELMHSAMTATAHTDFLDDINLLLGRGFGKHAMEQVRTVINKLAKVGLGTSLVKSRANAQRGTAFSPADRANLKQLGIPYSDSTTPEADRGFVTVGVPVGAPQYVHGQLHSKLFDPTLWRLAWQLIGMADGHLQEAMLIYRGSFCKRMGFVARNVSPQLAAPWLAGYDGLCTWVLERMLHLHGASGAHDMQQHLQQACLSGDTLAASTGGPLLLSTLGPQGLCALPQAISQWPGSEGGLGCPKTSSTLHSAHVAQRLSTLKPGLQAVLNGLSGTVPLGLAQAPAVQSYRASLGVLCRETDLPNKVQADCRLTEWAMAEQAPDDTTTLTVILGDGLMLNMQTDENTEDIGDHGNNDAPSTTSTDPTTSNTSWGHQHTGISRNKRTNTATQRQLTALQHRRSVQLMYDLLARSGREGKLALAQLRSQKAPHAKAWLGHAGVRRGMSSAITAAMVLSLLTVSPFTLIGEGCPYPGCTYKGPITVEHMITCTKQHLRGPNALHTIQCYCLMNICKRMHVRGCTREDSSMFTIPDDGAGRRADVVIPSGAMAMCADHNLRIKGAITDSSIGSPVAQMYLRGAAVQDGYTAQAREAEKHRHYDKHFKGTDWVFAPIVQETYGRLGKETGAFLKQIAIHAANCTGGDELSVRTKAGYNYAYICDELSTSLAAELGQRMLAYVRGAYVHTGGFHAISALLEPRGL
jgi:hypothetical protein